MAAGLLNTLSSIWPSGGAHMPWVYYLTHLGWALASIVLVEMVRDFYHFLGHRLPPLQRLHNWHHRAYKKDFSPISAEVYRKAQLMNDAPEANEGRLDRCDVRLGTHRAGLIGAVDHPWYDDHSEDGQDHNDHHQLNERKATRLLQARVPRGASLVSESC